MLPAWKRTAALRWKTTSLLEASRPLIYAASHSPSFSSPTRPPFLSARSLHQTSNRWQSAIAAEAVDTEERQHNSSASQGPATTFRQLAERGLVNNVLIRTITEKMGIETMTEVQMMTINEALKGTDVLAQAKTGTGKTIGFLLPVLQNILGADPSLLRRQHSRAPDIRAIVISPTRELAEQIAVEARKLAQGTGIVVQTAVGGTQKSMHLRAIQREGCHLLIGTPGRLNDVLSDSYSGIKAPNLTAFVLDEADRLLDQGFLPDIQKIQKLLPSRAEQDRQTLMFSATVPREVVTMVRSIMKRDLHYVRTVQENDVPTHERVKQMLVTVPSFENQLPALLELCYREIKAAEDPSSGRRPFKAIVYFNATAEAQTAFNIFMALRPPGSIKNLGRNTTGSDNLLGRETRIFGISSRLTQAQRTFAADRFRQAPSAILMSSDVTARGMDFPGVTHVIQIGLPQERDTYIHRLGRTARAGQEGEGWLIIAAPMLSEARNRLGKLPIQSDRSLQTAQVSFEEEPEPEMPESTKVFYDTIREAAKTQDTDYFVSTYMAFLGIHMWFRDKAWLVGAMNRQSKVVWGMQEPPSIGRTLATKMGLQGIPGVRYGSNFRDEDGGGSGGRFGSMDRNSSRGYGSRSGNERFGRDGGSSYGGDGRSGSFREKDGSRSGGFGGRNDGFERGGRTGGGGYGGGDRRGAGGYDRGGGTSGFGNRERRDFNR